MVTRRAVFLDRDGVLAVPEMRDGRSYAVRRVEDFRLYDDAVPAVRALADAGWTIVVATNQPDIANGLVAPETVAAMHAILARELPLDAIEVCPHAQGAGCACRKPKPGMLLAAAARLGIDLRASFMVGDRAGDIAAGKAAGCRTVFVDRGYDRPDSDRPDRIVASLAEGVAFILADAPAPVAGSVG